MDEEVFLDTYTLPRKSPLKIPPKWNVPGYKVRISIIKIEEEDEGG